MPGPWFPSHFFHPIPGDSHAESTILFACRSTRPWRCPGTRANDALHGTPVESVPEPGGLTMAVLGLLALGLAGLLRRAR